MRTTRARWTGVALALALAAVGAPSAGVAQVARGWIDTSNRSAVLSAYDTTFNTAVPAPGWTGNVGSCQAGTLSAAHRAAVMARVNWYRAMGGVLDGVTEDTTFSAKAQQAALMMAANNSLSHTPPTSWNCYTADGAEAAGRSNLYLGRSGVPAIDGFIEDPGANNTAVGHRSWILEPTQARMGVGSIPVSPQSSALYVIDSANLFPPTRPSTREANSFVSWPPRGFVPSPTVYPRWSLHNNYADFSAAAVQVTVGGQAVPVTVENRGAATTGRPGPTLVFVPTLPTLGGADVAVTVTVTGIGGTGIPSTYSWTTTVISPTPVPPTSRVAGDYTGDGRTDLAVFRPSQSVWYVAGGASQSWGASGDIPVPGDYNGDGRTDFAVFRPTNSVWYANGVSQQWGASGDIPVPGDYDGDGRTDFAVFRPSQGVWYVAGGTSQAWGASGDIPVPGDYDGDGRTDFAVYRPSLGVWYVNGVSQQWGASGDIPVPGDYNGDRRTDFAVFRPSQGVWYVNGGSQPWGASGDVPVPGDYNGDGRADFAVYRPSSGVWYVNGTSQAWGVSGDIPLPLPYAIRRVFFP